MAMVTIWELGIISCIPAAGDLLWVWGGGGSAASGWGSVYPKKRGAVVTSGEAQESRILVCHLFPVSHPTPSLI